MDRLEIRRKRALYRANHRGTKELDLILGRYAKERLRHMDEAELEAFEALLAMPDPVIDLQIWHPDVINATPAAASVRSFLESSGGLFEARKENK
jgi:antitoxin CptB